MSDRFCLAGKNAVVIGGAGGLGQGITTGFVEAGANVVIASRHLDNLQRAAREIEAATGDTVTVHQVDCRIEQTVKDLVATVEAEMSQVDILVNAQGVNYKASALEFSMEEWDDLFATNVRGVMLCCRAFAAGMIKNGGGKIINLSSVRGRRAGLGGNSGYCASKGAVDMITRQLAREWAEYGVNVNAIGPIITPTPMMAQRMKDEASRYERMLGNVPMGRWGRVDDIVGPALFLASSASDFVTGSILYPDGGSMAFL
ncbi:MAG: SDR family oxidoreductase [Actinobacteria bacterium]|nr:SDR family oxidoreductase [Actinomycetota bacterium]